MKTEIESLQSYAALSLIVIGILVRFSPAYLGLTSPGYEFIFHTLSYAFFFLGLPIVLYQITRFDRRVTVFCSSASILFLIAAFLQFELLDIVPNNFMLFIKVPVMVCVFAGLIILMAGIGYKRGLK